MSRGEGEAISQGDDFGRVGTQGSPEISRKPKVAQLQAAFVVEQIGKLQITMNDPMLVHEGNRVKYLDQQSFDLRFCERRIW